MLIPYARTIFNAQMPSSGCSVSRLASEYIEPPAVRVHMPSTWTTPPSACVTRKSLATRGSTGEASAVPFGACNNSMVSESILGKAVMPSRDVSSVHMCLYFCVVFDLQNRYSTIYQRCSHISLISKYTCLARPSQSYWDLLDTLKSEGI